MCLYCNSERCLLPYNAAKALQDKMVETVCTEVRLCTEHISRNARFTIRTR